MIKMSSRKFMIITLIPMNILTLFLKHYYILFSLKNGREVLKTDNFILFCLLFINMIILLQTIKRIREYKKEKLEIEFKRSNGFFISVILFSILSIVSLYFSYISESLLLFLLAIFLILLAINGVISFKMLSGVSGSYVFYNGKQIPIEDIESYDIDSRNINIRTSNTLFFINVFEITTIPNGNNDEEKFEQIFSNSKNVITE